MSNTHTIPRKSVPVHLPDVEALSSVIEAKADKSTIISSHASPYPNIGQESKFTSNGGLCFQLRRRTLIIICIVSLLLLGLVIGLAVGLTKRARYCHSLPCYLYSYQLIASIQFLPLPTDRSQFTGDLTYYSPALGACGIITSENDYVCAVSHFIYDSQSKGPNPNNNPLCGLMLRAVRYDERVGLNRSLDLTVVDRCKPASMDLRKTFSAD